MLLVHLRSGFAACFLFCLTFVGLNAQTPVIRHTVTQIINRHFDGYPISFDNQLRLAIYAELKGRYGATHRQILLDFEEFGEISFYADNCIIKSPEGVINLNKQDGPPHAEANQLIHGILENLMLFSNHRAAPDHIAFVDHWLARKNIEPFHKIYTRHLLLRYGRFDAAAQQLVFHTDYISPTEDVNASLVKAHKTPLKMVLDSTSLRGYYLKAGGQVFVEDTHQALWYATEEGKAYNNITAYKLFLQLLITETIPYISRAEDTRQQKIDRVRQIISQREGKPLSRYSSDEWILFLLSSLRSQQISPSDPDILRHLVRQPHFDRIYAHMTEEEKAAADSYRSYSWYLDQ